VPILARRPRDPIQSGRISDRILKLRDLWGGSESHCHCIVKKNRQEILAGKKKKNPIVIISQYEFTDFRLNAWHGRTYS
jgi:hypothetical protein